MTAIAIDGPAGAGKSTVARRLADYLGWTYVDTGAMYRAVALAALEAAIDLDDEDALTNLATGLSIELVEGRWILEGRDVSDAIRSHEMARAASRVARSPGVRRALVARQRQTAQRGDVVMEGRDIGSVVLPDADVKVFLTATLDERARRRDLESAPDDSTTLAGVKRALETRDAADATRPISPLVPASGSIEIDTTELSVDEVVERIAAMLAARPAGTGDG
jgi:cytidylate kinase